MSAANISLFRASRASSSSICSSQAGNLDNGKRALTNASTLRAQRIRLGITQRLRVDYVLSEALQYFRILYYRVGPYNLFRLVLDELRITDRTTDWVATTCGLDARFHAVFVSDVAYRYYQLVRRF